STSRTSSPRRAKSAARMLGAITAGCVDEVLSKSTSGVRMDEEARSCIRRTGALRFDGADDLDDGSRNLRRRQAEVLVHRRCRRRLAECRYADHRAFSADVLAPEIGLRRFDRNGRQLGPQHAPAIRLVLSI